MTIAEKLIALAPKIKKDLLVAPMVALERVMPHMSLITGVRGSYVGGLLSADAEFRPYKSVKGETDGGIDIAILEQLNYLGDVVVEFDPNVILNSIYGESIKKGMTDLQIVTKVAMVLAKKAGEKLYKNLFTATRNANGTTTAALFNGFSTLTTALITAAKVSVELGNYVDKSDVQITKDNCGDILKGIVRGADENLTDQDLKFFIPKRILEMYEDWYQIEHGVAPWNKGINQKTLVGYDNVELVALSNMSTQDYLYLTVKENMNILVDVESDELNALIRQCDNPKAVQFFMMCWFGVGIETVMKEYFTAVKFTTEVVGG